MILSQKSKDLISEYVEGNKLPVIGFKLNSSMHDIAQSFYSTAIGNNSSAMTALESFDSVEEFSFGKDAKAELDTIAAKMADKINGALGEIRAISAMSDAVVKEADDLFKSMSAADPVMAKYLSLENRDVKLVEMDWSALNSYGAESSIVMQVNSQIGMKDAHMVDIDRINVFVNQLPYISAQSQHKYATIADAKEYTEFTNSLKSEEGKELCKILVSERAAKVFMSAIVQYLRPVKGTVYNASLDLTKKYLSYLAAFADIRDTVTEELTGFGEKEYEQFQENMTQIEAYLDVVAYLAIAQRRTIYQDMFILPNGSINMDLKAAFDETGLTSVNVNNFIQYYTQILGHVPTGGVTIEQLKNESENIDKHVTEQIASAKFNAETKIRQFRGNALSAILNDKVVDARSKNIRGFNENHVRAQMKNEIEQVIVGAKTDFDAVNDFLMGLYHPFQMSERLYRDFKQAYKSALPDFGQITNTDVKMIESKVIARHVAEFCKKAFC